MDELLGHLRMPERAIKQEPTEHQDAAGQADAFLDTARHLLSPTNSTSAIAQAHSNATNYTPSTAATINDRRPETQAPSSTEANANGVHPARVPLLGSRQEMETRKGASAANLQSFSKGENAERSGARDATSGDRMEGVVSNNNTSSDGPPKAPTGFVDPYARNVMMLNNMAMQKGHRVKYDIYMKKGTKLYYGTVHIGPHKFSIHHPQATAMTNPRDAKLKLAKLGLERLPALSRGDINLTPSIQPQPPAGYERVPVPSASTSQASEPVPWRDAAFPLTRAIAPRLGGVFGLGSLPYRTKTPLAPSGDSVQLSSLVTRHPASVPAKSGMKLVPQADDSLKLSSLVSKGSSLDLAHIKNRKKPRHRDRTRARGQVSVHSLANVTQVPLLLKNKPNSIEAVLGHTDMLQDGNWITLLHEWMHSRPGGMTGKNKPEFRISREPPSSGKSEGALGWTAFVTIPEFNMKTFGSGKKYIASEKAAKQLSARKAVEWLIEEGHLKGVDRDGHIRKRKVSPDGRSSASLQDRPAKRVLTGPASPGSIANLGGSRYKQEQDERSRELERERERSRSRRERARDRSRDDKERDREHVNYRREYDSYTARYRERSRGRSRERSRERDRRDWRSRDRSFDRDFDWNRERGRDRDLEKSRDRHRSDKDRESTKQGDVTKAPARSISAVQAPPKSAPIPAATNGSVMKIDPSVNGTTSGNTDDDYVAKANSLAPLLGFSQPKVYYMPSDPLRWPKSIFNGSVHFPGHFVDGTDGAAVIQIRDEPIAGEDAAKQLLYKRAFAWLEKQQDDREKALEQQLKQLRELRTRKTEPTGESEL